MLAFGIFLPPRYAQGEREPFWTPERDAGVWYRRLDGDEMFIPDVHMGVPWFSVGDTPPLFYFWERGVRLVFEREGPRVFVSCDGAPPALAGVVFNAPGGSQALREALERGASGFILWVPGNAIGELPDLPPEARIAISVRDESDRQLEALGRLRHAHALRVRIGSRPCDLRPLVPLTRLVSLDLSGCVELADLGPLRAMPELRSLSLWGCKKVTDLTPLAGLRRMERLLLTGCTAVSDLAPLAGMEDLVFLRLSYCGRITDLRPLAKLTKLRALYLDQCTEVADLTPLSDLTHLVFLQLQACRRVTDLSPLGRMARLKYLGLYGCEGLRDIAPLASLRALESLTLNGCEAIKDLGHLAHLPRLRRIDLVRCDGIKDLSPLRAAAQRGADIFVDPALEAQLKRLRQP